MISILLPIRNEANFIRKCLDAILQQSVSVGQIEVIIADGMSEDGTREIIREYQRLIPQIFLINNEKRIVSSGLNAAIRFSKGEFIIRVDGHCIIDKDYVKNCVHHLRNDGVDGVGGPMQTIGETELSNTIALAMSSRFGVGNSAFRTTDIEVMNVDTIAFPAYKREIIKKVGFYDEELVRNQDDEYNYRIREMGGKLLLASDVRSKYYSRGSYSKLWKQYYQYGYWKVRVFQKHPRQMSLRQFVPATLVFSLVLSLILTLTISWGWVTLSLIAGNYIIANLTASILTTRRKGGEHLAPLSLVFAILHISYGTGFLVGLLKFWNRWRDKFEKNPIII